MWSTIGCGDPFTEGHFSRCPASGVAALMGQFPVVHQRDCSTGGQSTPCSCPVTGASVPSPHLLAAEQMAVALSRSAQELMTGRPQQGWGQAPGAPEPEFVTWTEPLPEGPVADVLRRQALAAVEAEEAGVRAGLTARVRAAIQADMRGTLTVSLLEELIDAGIDSRWAEVAVGVFVEFQRGRLTHDYRYSDRG